MSSKYNRFSVLIASLILAGCQTQLPRDRPAQIRDILIPIRNIIGLLAPLALIAFFVMLIVGGFQLLMSGGDPKAAAGARQTLTYAVLGIILVVVVWLLLLLIQRLTGIDLIEVNFPI